MPEPGMKSCEFHLAKQREYCERNREKIREHNARAVQKLREETLAAYGGCCSVCGEDDSVVLELDHINGMDEASRKIPRGGTRLYRHLKKMGYPRGGFQILCANCHRRKTFHQLGWLNPSERKHHNPNKGTRKFPSH